MNTRTKKTEEANGGICEGEAEMEDVCNTEACPRKCLWPNKENLFQMFIIYLRIWIAHIILVLIISS